MYVTSTNFRQNIGKYLELCDRENVFIMKHGEVFAKLCGTKIGKGESIRKISGSLCVETDKFSEESEENI